jgi:Tfp pilus assembly protein PilX
MIVEFEDEEKHIVKNRRRIVYMTKLKIKSSKSNEKGVALVFTLLVLALLLILALGFALSSMFNQTAARNAANASFAGFLAQTQLKEVLSLIQNDEANLENSEFYSRDSGSPAVTHTDMLKDMLNERLSVPGLLETIDTAKVNWNYIRSKDSAQRIIGRTAFVAIADGVPLGSLVDGRVGTTAYPKHDEELDAETRIGKYMSEINVRHAVPDTVKITAHTVAEVNSMTAALNWQGVSANNTVPGFDGGKYTGNWADFKSLFAVIETAIAPGSLSDNDKAEFQNNLSVTAAKDKEAFWADIGPAGSPDGNIDSNELYKRFDLTRADWSAPTTNALDLTFIKDKILLTSGTVPNLDMEKWDNTDSGNTSRGLPWLAAFGYKADGSGLDTGLNGTFSNVVDRRLQIAANLKDYCDDDGAIIRPTSDVDPATWVSSADPTYTGNERTPYINEVGFKVTATSTITPSGANYDVTVAVSVTPCVELINIYQNSFAAVDVTVKGTVRIKTTNGSLEDESDYSLDAASPINVSSWTAGYSNLSTSSSPVAKSFTALNRPTQGVSIEIISFQIDKIVLHTNDAAKNGYDYTKSLTGAKDLPLSFSVADQANPQTAWFGFAVHDPRHNLHSSEWLELIPESMLATAEPTNVFSILAGYVGTSNAANSVAANCTEEPSVGVDKETTADPVNMSTAFIRNAPMESPWELGFIHRGARWQTVNLKTYDTSKAFKVVDIGGKNYIPGGGAYTAGDANILDQIKMTEKAESPQKISLKSQKSEVFEALFAKIKYGCVIDSTVSVNSMAGLVPLSGTELTGAQTIFFGNKIVNKYKATANPDERRTRASAVNTLLLPELVAVPAIAAATDAKQEELIGKIINLTEIGGKVGGFTIIILAQTIKDIGTSSGITIQKYSDDGTSGSRLCKLSTFDAAIDLTDSKKCIYYDEITAEQKIIVKGYRTNDGNIRITSFQYID